MGSGKSTVGRDLATRLGRRHRDTDAAVAHRAGCSISEIFAKSGEAEFRRREREMLIRILGGPPAVVSTGGGIVVDPDNRELLAEPFVVWLDAGIDDLERRVKGGRGRPLLDGDLRANLQAKIAEREPHYREVADLRVDTSGMSRRATVEFLLSAIGEDGEE